MATKNTDLYDAKGNLHADTLYDPTTGTGAGHINNDENDPKYESQDAKRAEITDYVRMRLADGIVDVELENEHYEMALKQALIKYRQRSSNAVEESYAMLQLTPETQEYILPKEIMEVRTIYRRGIGSVTGTTSSQFEPFASGYLNTYMLVAGRVGGLVNYELFAQYQKLAMKMFGGFMNYTYNKSTKKLIIERKMPYQGTGQHTIDDAETVLLWCYNYKPDWMLLNDYQVFPWLQEYAYSFAKRLLGEARSKYSTIAGPNGGVQLNGVALIAEAKEEIENLEEEIKRFMDGGMPMTWITG
jgi:hypothetical protein